MKKYLFLLVSLMMLIPLRANAVIVAGDLNNDCVIDISDLTELIGYVLGEGSGIAEADANGDGFVDVDDITDLINFLLHAHQTFVVNGVTFSMIKVDGGTFMMGATAEQGTIPKVGESPAHQVTLSTYSIGETEVTQALWLAVMGNNPSKWTGDLNRPVECVSWEDIQVFIATLNEITGKTFRLPTEAEWEFAARGGNKSQGYRYAGSNDVDEVSWYGANSNTPTHTVAQKKANELGTYDMSGNVHEWCQDWYDKNYYSVSPSVNPTGPEEPTQFETISGVSAGCIVCRGGTYWMDASYSRVAYRHPSGCTGRWSDLGFRLAL